MRLPANALLADRFRVALLNESVVADERKTALLVVAGLVRDFSRRWPTCEKNVGQSGEAYGVAFNIAAYIVLVLRRPRFLPLRPEKEMPGITVDFTPQTSNLPPQALPFPPHTSRLTPHPLRPRNSHTLPLTTPLKTRS